MDYSYPTEINQATLSYGNDSTLLGLCGLFSLLINTFFFSWLHSVFCNFENIVKYQEKKCVFCPLTKQYAWTRILWVYIYVRGGGLVIKLWPTLTTTWTVAHQAPLSMGFSRQEYGSGLPFPSSGDLSHPGIEPGSPVLQADSLPTELRGNFLCMYICLYIYIFWVILWMLFSVTFFLLHTWWTFFPVSKIFCFMIFNGGVYRVFHWTGRPCLI